ncbi:MAG: DUF4440 domain-containing protein, partial [Bacteroidota bacterium]
MKKIHLVIFCIFVSTSLFGQESKNNKDSKAIYSLIDQYTESREKRDTVLLKSILMDDIDQLVSSGEWRMGIHAAVIGMMQSSEANSGSRKIIIDKLRFLNNMVGLVDARYEIQNADGSIRKMWSTFMAVKEKGVWKIAAIRNMLPT